MKKLRLFEFYAGYGGAAFGLQKANIDFESVGFSEIKPGVIKIYSQNHSGVKNYGDVTKINPEELPDFDICTGGFPCQDVSLVGLRDLSKGRTKTVFNMLEIIRVKKPKYVLLENVKGITSMLDGELLRSIVRLLKSYGYAVSYKLLNSSEYGTPQNRERVWIVAELERAAFGFNPFPSKCDLDISMTDLLEKEVDNKYYLTKLQLETAYKKAIDRGKNLENNFNLEVGRCLTARHPKRAMHDINLIKDHKGIRILTPKESFRKMGFFLDEIILDDVSETQIYEAAGNGWDVNLVSKIFIVWLNEYIIDN